MRIITVSNQKGGVAKSTSVVNMAAGLSKLGKKVLIIDMDPQGNCTSGLDMKKNIKCNLYDILVKDVNLRSGIMNTSWDGLDIIGTSIVLANAELDLANKVGRETILRDAIKDNNLNEYDYIIIDTSPSLGNLTINALSAADEVIIPVEPGSYALEGMDYLIKIINLLKKKINPDLSIRGVLLTRVHPIANIVKDFEEEVREIFGDRVFKTLIHNNVKVVEAEAEKIPIVFYKEDAKAGMEYMEFVKEFLNGE